VRKAERVERGGEGKGRKLNAREPRVNLHRCTMMKLAPILETHMQSFSTGLNPGHLSTRAPDPGPVPQDEALLPRPPRPATVLSSAQGLTLVHFSAQPELFLTQNKP